MKVPDHTNRDVGENAVHGVRRKIVCAYEDVCMLVWYDMI